MFAFALWDNSRKELFIGRDRFGMKPLFFYKDQNIFVFSSTLKSLKKIQKLNINFLKSLFDYFLYGYVSSPKTI